MPAWLDDYDLARERREDLRRDDDRPQAELHEPEEQEEVERP